jgi:hypothetical protein
MTYHAFQAISDVDRALVTRIGPTRIAANSAKYLGCNPGVKAKRKSYIKVAANPIAMFYEPMKSMPTILGHTPKVPSRQMERMVTTLRSYLHSTMARHAQTTSLRIG